MTWTDTRTTTVADTEALERHNAHAVGRYDDAEPDEPFTMPRVPLDDDYPPLRAFLRVYGEWT